MSRVALALGVLTAVAAAADDLGEANMQKAAQQVTSNLVVERKKDQTRIEGMYSKQLKAPAPAKPGATPALPAGTRVKEIDRRGDEVKVRTMEGDEAWVPKSSL